MVATLEADDMQLMNVDRNQSGQCSNQSYQTIQVGRQGIQVSRELNKGETVHVWYRNSIL